jgi:hypothetical protein
MRRYGWLAFWIQLSLSVISGVILLFSVAFTASVGAARWQSAGARAAGCVGADGRAATRAWQPAAPRPRP